MDPGPFVVALLLLGGLLALFAQGVVLALAARMPRLDPLVAASNGPFPKVSAVVAARNEELDLPGALDGLIAQDYPNLEILVIDGGSTDRTREVALARSPRVRLLEEPPLPDGWVGKNWACDVGYRASTGAYLLFTDADVRYHPGVVSATVSWARSERAALATLAPRVEMVGFWENVVLPFYVQMVLTYFLTPRVNRDTSSAAMANGQYLCVRRDDYERVGGHMAIRGAVLEDVALARKFRAAGLRLRVAWAPELLSTRMYRDRHEMFEGLLKNVHGTEFSAWRQLGFFFGLLAVFFAPLVLLPLGLFWQDVPLIVEGFVLYVLLFVKHSLFARAVRGSGWYGLLFPLAVGFYLALIVASLGRGIAGRPIEWKGRAYALRGGR